MWRQGPWIDLAHKHEKKTRLVYKADGFEMITLPDYPTSLTMQNKQLVWNA
jgi:hypothetical protein